MKQNGRVNALLAELLIVVLFFMLASTTLMEIFGAAKQASNRAGARSEAVMLAQNMAEALYAAVDVPAELAALGFSQQGEGWQLDCGTYMLKASYAETAASAGTLRETEISAEYEGEVLFTLPAARYVPGEVQP